MSLGYLLSERPALAAEGNSLLARADTHLILGKNYSSEMAALVPVIGAKHGGRTLIMAAIPLIKKRDTDLLHVCCAQWQTTTLLPVRTTMLKTIAALLSVDSSFVILMTAGVSV